MVGCDKNDLSVLQQQSSLQHFNKVPADVDSARHRVARSLAKAMGNSADLRSFVDSMAQTQPYGDYNFLFELEKNKSIGGTSVSSALANQSSQTSSYFSDSIELIDPTMVIHVYYPNDDITSWNTSTFKPLVAVYEDGMDDSTATSVPAYDHNGNATRITSSTPSSDVIVLIKQSERVVAIDMTAEKTSDGYYVSEYLSGGDPCVDDCFDAFYNSSNWSYMNYQVLIACLEDCYAGSGSGSGGSSGCDRNLPAYADKKEELHKWKFDSKADMLLAMGRIGWLLEGKVEMEATIVYHDSGPSSGTPRTSRGLFVHFREDYACNSSSCPWLIENWTTFIFDEEKNGDRYSVQWIEKDKLFGSGSFAEPKFNVEVPLPDGGKISFGISFKIAMDNDDEDLGSNEVLFCDNADVSGYEYTTGVIDWVTRVDH